MNPRNPRTAAFRAADKVWRKALAKYNDGDEHALDHAYKNAYNAALKAAKANGMDGMPAVRLAADAASGPKEQS